MFKYKKPFHVIDGRIRDAEGNEVRLWGVNYYAPFHHNYYNLQEMGIDHFQAIERDIRDFKRMGIELVRMHLFDREISDIDGNVVDNDHLRVLDYLIQRLNEEGIYVMLTPIAWWNTSENQVMVTNGYAYWDIGQSPAFGFSNFFPKHSMIWNEKALNCQERYLSQLFERKNSFSGKRWNRYENVVVIEIINEPEYPYPTVIERLKQNRDKLAANPIGREELKLLDLYDSYLNGGEDTHENRQHFCADLVGKYINRMFGVVTKYFGDTVLKTHIHYGYQDRDLHDVLMKSSNDSISVTMYAPCTFDTAHNDNYNFFGEIRNLKSSYTALGDIPKGLIAYEFNAPSTLTGYSLGALAYMMASMGIQIAAYFTYTPVDIAAYNPGWIVHYLNLYHTPSRAAAFTAAGEIFRKTVCNSPIPDNDVIWAGEGFEIKKDGDSVIYLDNEKFIYSNSGEHFEVKNILPQKIIGRGNSQFVRHDGNGCYFLEQISKSEWRLTVLPDQWYVSDPYRGKSFSMMGNRYINVNTVPVVSRLKEYGSKMKILYPGLEDATIKYLNGNRWKTVKTVDGEFVATPGTYTIKTK